MVGPKPTRVTNRIRDLRTQLSLTQADLAAALGVPVVSIFPLRSDIPARWRPAIDAHRIIRPCRYECGGTCVKETCPRFTCLLHIDPDEVVAAAREIAK